MDRVNCEKVVSSPLDAPPIRSPQAVHSFIAEYAAGKALVEIGTRNGDGMACFARHAKQAVAIEYEPRYCRSLRRRAAEAIKAGALGFNVTCSDYRAGGVLDGDIITWWQQGALANVPALKQLLREQLAGRVREAAEAILLFDLKWHVDLRQWRALCHLAAWSTLVPFDEQSRCLSKGAEKRRAHWSETCQRAKGQFIVASIPVRNVSRFGRLPKDARGTCPYLRNNRTRSAPSGGGRRTRRRLGESLGPHAQRIAICVTGFEHAFGEIEANVQAAIETLATNHRRPHVFGVVPRNASWAQVERMLARKGWRDDATIEAQQPRGSLTAPFNFWPQRKGRSFMLELHDCAQCERMMADREQAGGFTFDVVVRLRLDTYFEVPLSGVPAAIADDELHVPFMSRCGGGNDKFAVGGRGAMRAYLTRVRRLSESLITSRKSFRSEGLLMAALKLERGIKLRQRRDWAFCKVQSRRRCGYGCTWIDCATRVRNRVRCEYLRCDYCGNGCECWNASCAAGALAPPSNFSRPERDRKGRYASRWARLRNGSLAIIESRFAKATVCRELSSTTAVAAAAIKKASIRSIGRQYLMGDGVPS